MKRIAVIGAGSWGTALAISLASSGHDVRLLARRREAAAFMREHRRNPTYLPEAVIPDGVVITDEIAAAASDAEIWVIATPSQTVRAVAGKLAPLYRPGLFVVSVAKGIEVGTLKTTSQVLAEVLPVPKRHIVVLYGPSHAEEVAAGVPTAVVAATTDQGVGAKIQDTFMTPLLRVYVNRDVIGVEIAGSVKNIMAIAAGISDGVGYGDNAKAAIITRGMAEIRRLGQALGADASTFSGLAGIGDLVVTCMSKHSRNRHLGEQIGKGRTLQEIEAEMKMVAEGVRTTQSVLELARRHGVEMPITEAVHAILFEGKQPKIAVNDLMTRSAKHEEWLPTPAEKAGDPR